MSLSYLRFIRDADAPELVNLYHLARTAGHHTRHDRMLWASKEFAKAHSLTPTAAYKDLCTLLDNP